MVAHRMYPELRASKTLGMEERPKYLETLPPLTEKPFFGGTMCFLAATAPEVVKMKERNQVATTCYE